MYSGSCLKQMALLAIKAGCRYCFDLFHGATHLHYVLLKKGLTSQIQKNFITTTPRQTVAAQAGTPLSPVHLVSEVKPVLKFAKLSDNATVPTKGSPRAAGFDLYSAHDCSIAPMNKALVMTDIQIAVPTGCYGRVAPRSGLAVQHFIDVGGGVIDEDYRGNVGIVLFNFNKETFQVRKGDRIAQLICEKICFPDLEQHEALDETQRGAGGFGSTGSK